MVCHATIDHVSIQLLLATLPITIVLIEKASSVKLLLSCWLDRLTLMSRAELLRLETMSTTCSSGVKKATLST